MFSDIIARIKLPFRKDKELYLSMCRILGFCPNHLHHYKQALMHKSMAHRNEKGKFINNERLEFLGDAVLDAVVGDIVYRHFPGKREGFLTNTRSKLVQREMLNRLADEMGITQLVITNNSISSHNNYIGGNAFEALVGAIYLDKGYDACMKFMEKRILAKIVNLDTVAYNEVNFKSRLIEWSQKHKVELVYRLIEQKRDHDGSPMFQYVAVLGGVDCCSATGYSKKESQQEASRLTLERLRREPQLISKILKKDKDTDAKKTDSKADKAAAKPKRSNATKKEASIIEFDLSDISVKAKTREQIIEEAEAEAFAAVKTEGKKKLRQTGSL